MSWKKIFISYRREDSSGDARSIYLALKEKFGSGRIFMDVDSVRHGTDFREAVRDCLSDSAVLIAIIGSQWMGPKEGSEYCRIDDEDDFVRIEIASAIKDNILIVPVLINESALPKSGDLPKDIQDLSYRQSLRIRHESFRTDVIALEATVRSALGNPKKQFGFKYFAGGVALLVIAALGLFFQRGALVEYINKPYLDFTNFPFSEINVHYDPDITGGDSINRVRRALKRSGLNVELLPESKDAWYFQTWGGKVRYFLPEHRDEAEKIATLLNGEGFNFEESNNPAEFPPGADIPGPYIVMHSDR